MGDYKYSQIYLALNNKVYSHPNSDINHLVVLLCKIGRMNLASVITGNMGFVKIHGNIWEQIFGCFINKA